MRDGQLAEMSAAVRRRAKWAAGWDERAAMRPRGMRCLPMDAMKMLTMGGLLVGCEVDVDLEPPRAGQPKPSYRARNAQPAGCWKMMIISDDDEAI